MSAPAKTYTERDLVLAKREGYREGAYWRSLWPKSETSNEDAARNAFPLPKVERPRVVRDNHGFEWRVRDDVLEYRYPASAANEWQRSTNLCSEDRRRTLADLLANPTELVEAES